MSVEKEKKCSDLFDFIFFYFFQEVEKRCNNKGREKKVPRREAHTRKKKEMKTKENFKEVFERMEGEIRWFFLSSFNAV